MLVSLPLAIVAALFTYFFARHKESKYTELPTTLTYSGFIRRTTAFAIDVFILMIVLEIVIILYNMKYGNSIYESYQSQDFSGFLFRPKLHSPYLYILLVVILCIIFYFTTSLSSSSYFRYENDGY